MASPSMVRAGLRTAVGLAAGALLGLTGSVGAQAPVPGTLDAPDSQAEPGSAIFIHPDGAGVAHWGAARLLIAGPDGTIAWDRLEHLGVYRGHLTNSLGSSSHGGATAHAYGVKVPYESYGMRGTARLMSLSGKPYSIMLEAREAGLRTALVNSGHLAEPGTGVFAASAPSRADIDDITRQLIESGIDIILGGGEVLMVPEDEAGHFGYAGVRRDGVDLVDRARELGYEIVYTRDQLLALPDSTPRVLGLFAPGHSFVDRTEEELAALEQEPYLESAPTLAEMTGKALRMLAGRGRFLMVVEEEGSDNFANLNNASATLTALARADAALGVALEFVEENPATLLITTADSNAGGLQVWPVREPARFELPLPPATSSGGALDGINGTGTPPFVAEPDRTGTRLRFGIAWAGETDMLGGILVRAHGLNAELLPPSVQNTDIYRMLYATLFGKVLPAGR